MRSREKDIRNILKHYVSRPSLGEIEITEEIKNIEIRSRYHNENNYDRIDKDIQVSYGKSKSLDYEQAIRVKDEHHKESKSIVEDPNTDHHLPRPYYSTEDFATTQSSYNSLPGGILNSIFPDKSNHFSQKKSNKTRSFRSIFTIHKKIKKCNVDMSHIDMLAGQQVSELKEMKTEASILHSSSSGHQDRPFRSFKIGKPLQPMRNKIKIPGFLKNMVSPSFSWSRGSIWPHKTHRSNNNEQKYSTTDQSSMQKTECPMTAVDEHKPATHNISDDIFDTTNSDRTYRRMSYPDKLCDCYNKRLDIMAGILNSIIDNNKSAEAIKEQERFDIKTLHLKNCPFVNSAGLRKDSHSSSNHSHLSLYQSCEYCSNVDDQLHPAISVHLLPLIHKLETGDEINFNEDHLKFFLSASCYKEFEEGMRQSIGVKCSVRNLAYLHYVTRKVVRHIGDPNEENNEHIRRIMHFAEKYCVEHYNDDIEVHGSMEEFLKRWTQSDID